jgi:hypothetical protein
MFTKSRYIHLETCIPRSFHLQRSVLFPNINFYPGGEVGLLAIPLREREAIWLVWVIKTELRARIPRGIEQYVDNVKPSVLNETHVTQAAYSLKRNTKVDLI